MNMAHSTDKINYRRHILPCPFKGSITEGPDESGERHDRFAARSPAWPGNYLARDMPMFRRVLCREHHRDELVPESSYAVDLHVWYRIGLHPRFSVGEALTDLGWRYKERRDLMNAVDVVRPILRAAMMASVNRRAFKKEMAKHAPVTLYNLGRAFRVTRDFKRKFEQEAFTVGDFMAEPNQERRRMMLRRGVDLKEVLQRLEHIETDDEGSIYCDRNRGQFYLHVKCPSTGEEYLLGVPRQWEGGFRAMTPREARRWTFGLDKDAEFVAEA